MDQLEEGMNSGEEEQNLKQMESFLLDDSSNLYTGLIILRYYDHWELIIQWYE